MDGEHVERQSHKWAETPNFKRHPPGRCDYYTSVEFEIKQNSFLVESQRRSYLRIYLFGSKSREN